MSTIILIILLFLGIVLGISAVVFLIKYIIGKTTIETDNSGLIVLDKEKGDINIDQLRFSLFTRGENKQTSNYTKGFDSNHRLWEYFNYEYFSHDNNSKYEFIVAKTAISNIPNLIVQYNLCNHKVGDIFGYRELTYESREELQNFKISCKDDIEAFKTFNEKFLGYLSKEVRGNIEIENEQIIYYENSGNSNLKDMIKKLDNIISLLRG